MYVSRLEKPKSKVNSHEHASSVVVSYARLSYLPSHSWSSCLQAVITIYSCCMYVPATLHPASPLRLIGTHHGLSECPFLSMLELVLISSPPAHSVYARPHFVRSLPSSCSNTARRYAPSAASTTSCSNTSGRGKAPFPPQVAE